MPTDKLVNWKFNNVVINISFLFYSSRFLLKTKIWAWSVVVYASISSKVSICLSRWVSKVLSAWTSHWDQMLMIRMNSKWMLWTVVEWCHWKVRRYPLPWRHLAMQVGYSQQVCKSWFTNHWDSVCNISHAIMTLIKPNNTLLILLFPSSLFLLKLTSSIISQNNSWHMYGTILLKNQLFDGQGVIKKMTSTDTHGEGCTAYHRETAEYFLYCTFSDPPRQPIPSLVEKLFQLK